MQRYYKLYMLDKISTALIISSPYWFTSPLSLLNIYKYNFDIPFSKLHETSNKLFFIRNKLHKYICMYAYVCIPMRAGIYIHINILFHMYKCVCVRVLATSNCCLLANSIKYVKIILIFYRKVLLLFQIHNTLFITQQYN